MRHLIALGYRDLMALKNGLKTLRHEPWKLLILLPVVIAAVLLLIPFESAIHQTPGLQQPSDLLRAGVVVWIVLFGIGLPALEAVKRCPVPWMSGLVSFVYASPVSPRTVIVWSLLRASGIQIVYSLPMLLFYGTFVDSVRASGISTRLVLWMGVSLISILGVVISHLVFVVSDRYGVGPRIKAGIGILAAVLGVVVLRGALGDDPVRGMLAAINQSIIPTIPPVSWLSSLVWAPFPGAAVIPASTALLWSFMAILAIGLAAVALSGNYYETAARQADELAAIMRRFEAQRAGREDIALEGLSAKKGSRAPLVDRLGLSFRGPWSLFWRMAVQFERASLPSLKFSVPLYAALGVGAGLMIRKGVLEYYYPLGLLFLMSLGGGALAAEARRRYIHLIPGSGLMKVLACSLPSWLDRWVFTALFLAIGAAVGGASLWETGAVVLAALGLTALTLSIGTLAFALVPGGGFSAIVRRVVSTLLTGAALGPVGVFALIMMALKVSIPGILALVALPSLAIAAFFFLMAGLRLEDMELQG